MIHLERHPRGTVLTVRAHPGAKRTAVLGILDGALRVAVTAVADKGKANQALFKYVSELFGMPKSDVELLSGAKSRQKRLLLVGLELERAGEVISSL